MKTNVRLRKFSITISYVYVFIKCQHDDVTFLHTFIEQVLTEKHI